MTENNDYRAVELITALRVIMYASRDSHLHSDLLKLLCAIFPETMRVAYFEVNHNAMCEVKCSDALYKISMDVSLYIKNEPDSNIVELIKLLYRLFPAEMHHVRHHDRK